MDDPIASIWRGHRCKMTDAHSLAESFVVSKDKRFVFPNWTASRSAELIPIEGRYRSSIEVISSVQRAIPHELISVAVKRIRSRARDGADNASGGPAVLC